MRRLLGVVLFCLFVAVPAFGNPKLSVAISPGPTPTTNTLTFTMAYPYDNLNSKGCAVGAVAGCVARFSFFEQIGGVPSAELASLPSTPGAITPQSGIVATAIVPTLTPGSHVYGVVAVTPDGVKSNPTLAASVVVSSIAPNAATSLSVSVGP